MLMATLITRFKLHCQMMRCVSGMILLIYCMFSQWYYSILFGKDNLIPVMAREKTLLHRSDHIKYCLWYKDVHVHVVVCFFNCYYLVSLPAHGTSCYNQLVLLACCTDVINKFALFSSLSEGFGLQFCMRLLLTFLLSL